MQGVVEAKIKIDRWGRFQLLVAAVLLYAGSKLADRVTASSVRIVAK